MERRDVVKGMGAAEMLAMLMGGGAAEAEGLAVAEGIAIAEGSDETVYELRVYHLNEGKEPLILERFRTKETKIFERLGMHGVAYWVTIEEPLGAHTLVYLLRHKSREAARESWAKFKVDPEWVALKAVSEKDGVFVAKAESTFLRLTDFSPRV